MFLRELYDASRVLDGAADMESLASLIPEQASLALGLDRAVFAVIEDGWMKVKSAYFVDRPDLARNLEQQSLELVYSDDVAHDSFPHESILCCGCGDEHSWQECLCRDWMHSGCCVLIPVASRGEVMGIIAVSQSDPDKQIDDSCLQASSVFSRLVTHAIESVQRQSTSDLAAERARQRIAELSLLQEINHKMHAQMSVESILAALLSEVHYVVAYDYAAAAVLDPDDLRWSCVTRDADRAPLLGYEDRLRSFDLTRLEALPPAILLGSDVNSRGLSDVLLEDSRAHLSVPLLSDRELIGFVMLGTRDPYGFAASDLKLVTAVSDVAAGVISRSRLYSRAVRSEERMRNAFMQIGDALSSGLGLDQTLQSIVKLASSMVNGDGSSLLMLDEDQRQFVVHAAEGLDPSFHVGRAMPRDHLLANSVAEGGRGIILPETPDDEKVVPWFPGHIRPASLIAVPVVFEGRVNAVMEVYSNRPNAFVQDDLWLMGWFAGHASVAIDNARSFTRDRGVSQAFIQSLLDIKYPELPGYEIGCKYEAALDEATIGGDFYDFVELPDGRVGVVVGDVSGKGLAAAVYTSMAKYMLRAYAIEDPRPASVMKRLNNALERMTDPSVFLTLFYALLSPNEATVAYSSAGHEPALLVCESDGVRANGQPLGPALGVIAGAEFGEGTMELPGDCALLLYTDGITEAGRGVPRMLGIDGLMRIAGNLRTRPAAQMVEEIYQETLAFAGKMHDDVVLIALKRTKAG